MIPFRYGSVVSGRDFCGREELLAQLKNFIESGQNLVLQGERRIGKTSLIHESVLRQKERRGLFLDLLGIKTVDDLCLTMLRGIVALEKKGNFFDRAVRSFAYLRPQLGVDYTGTPTITFDASVALKADSIPEIMGLIQELQKRKPLVVVFDEFQEILEIDDPRGAIAQLRSQIQYQTDIPFIFAGSVRNKMDEIFISPDSPFYKSAIPLTVGPLSYEEFAPFLQRRFEQGKRTITDDVLEKVFELTEEISGDIQQLCEALWSITSAGEEIGQAHFFEAIKLIFTREQKSYEIIISRLKSNQVKVLNALALLGGQSPTSATFVRTAGVKNASVVKQSLESLAAQKILVLLGKEWRYANPFFKAWILHRSAIRA